ncbi:hypothetical protein GTU99_12870 [Streptomyces sp. PRKS01-65]|nr:hypothetical protein [Streptomyces harenosi]NEY33071.1 hypothetical protein [Streptomyces harenosi]
MHNRPPILYGAATLAALSLIWSGYAITDLMNSGPFGLSVAIAGDIGWITVLWAEARGVSVGGKTWAPAAAGWLIAVGVAVLLVFHGLDAQSTGQTIAGPFVVIVGKIVWVFALAATRDPAAPTREQQSELHAVMRTAAHETALLHARADAQIARIRAEAAVTLARDDADFEIGLERLQKQSELYRRTPITLPANCPPVPEQAPAVDGFDEAAEQAITVVGDPDREQPTTVASPPNRVREQVANKAVTSPNREPDQFRPAPSEQAATTALPTIADLVREQIAITPNNATVVQNVLAIRPDANKDSVAAAVRRARRKSEMEGGYG